MLCLLAIVSASQPRSAMDWIRAMEAMYSHLRSYRDTGVETGHESKVTLKTAFIRPGKMYFRYTDTRSTNYFCASGTMALPSALPAIGRSPDRTPTWMAQSVFNGKVERDSLELAIAG